MYPLASCVLDRWYRDRLEFSTHSKIPTKSTWIYFHYVYDFRLYRGTCDPFFSLLLAILKGYLVKFWNRKFIVGFFFFLRFPKNSTPFTENKLLENTIITQFNLVKRSIFFWKTKKRDVCVHTHTAVYTSGRSRCVCVHAQPCEGIPVLFSRLL
jgi:hypothetical protein